MKRALLAWLLLASLAVWAAPRTGEAAPDFTLPTLDGSANITLRDLRAGGPLVLWFPDVVAETPHALTVLHQLSEEAEVPLAVIPVVGPKPDAAQGLVPLFPDVQVLHDADGSVCLAYTGEFIVQVAPRRNLFLMDRRGKVRQIAFYPGVPARMLAGWLSDLR